MCREGSIDRVIKTSTSTRHRITSGKVMEKHPRCSVRTLYIRVWFRDTVRWGHRDTPHGSTISEMTYTVSSGTLNPSIRRSAQPSTLHGTVNEYQLSD